MLTDLLMKHRQAGGEPSDLEILILWRLGMDTYDIAKKFWEPESAIASRLPRILERDRQDEAWAS